MKLHLGCGERYLEGYVNIDFPLSEHTVQQKSVADLHADLLSLRYPAQSVDEIRLHHVFEHFPRQTACALLAAWHTWLKTGGALRIEVPDLVRTGLAALNPFASARRRCVAARHLFGTHEASWAAHKEAYSAASLRQLLEAFGFSAPEVRRNGWRGTHNFDMTAFKRRTLSRPECDAAAQAYLDQFLVDDSPTETRLLETWMGLYGRQADMCWALER